MAHPLLPQYLLPFAPGVVLGKEEDIKKALGRRATHLNLQEKGLKTLEGIGVCSSLKCLYAYNNRLTTVQNTFNGIENLSLLYLDNNHLTSLDGIEDIGKTLTKLYVSYNHFHEIGPAFIACQRLQELYIYNQSFPSPDTTFRFHPLAIQSLAHTLTVLDISNNHIRDDDLQYIQPLQRLENLYLQKNYLTDIATVCDFVSNLPHLTKLDIRGNPVTTSSVSGPGGAYKGAIINAAANSIHFSWLDGQPIKARYRRFVAGLVQVVQARQEDDEYREQMAARFNQLEDKLLNSLQINDSMDPSIMIKDPLAQPSLSSIGSQKTWLGNGPTGGIAGGASLASLNGRSLYLGGGEEDTVPDGLNRVRDRYGNWSFRFWDPTQSNPLIQKYAKQQQKLLFGPTAVHHRSSPRGPAIPPKRHSQHHHHGKLDPLQHHRALLNAASTGSMIDGGSSLLSTTTFLSGPTNHVPHQLYTENSTTDSFTTANSILFSDYGDNASVALLQEIPSETNHYTDRKDNVILLTSEKSSTAVPVDAVENIVTDVPVPNTHAPDMASIDAVPTTVPSTEEANTSIAATVPALLTVDDNELNGPGPDEDDEVRIGSDSRIKEDHAGADTDTNNASGNHSAFLRDLEGSDSLGEVAGSSARDPIDSTNAEDVLAATIVPRSRGTPGHHLVGGLSTVAESTGEITDETMMNGTVTSLPVASQKPPRPEQFIAKGATNNSSSLDPSANAAAMAYAAYKAQIELQSHAIGGADGFVSHKPVTGEPWQEVYIPVRTPSDYIRTSRFRDSGYTSFNDRAAAERKVAASLISRAKDISQSTSSLVSGSSSVMLSSSLSSPSAVLNSHHRTQQPGTITTTATMKGRASIQPLKSVFSSKLQLPPLGSTTVHGLSSPSSSSSLPVGNTTSVLQDKSITVGGTLRRGSTESFATLGSEITVDYTYGQGSGLMKGKTKHAVPNNSIINGTSPLSVTATMNVINTYTIGGALARYALHQEAQYPSMNAPVSPIKMTNSSSSNKTGGGKKGKGKNGGKVGGVGMGTLKKGNVSPSRILGPLPQGFHAPSPWTKG